MKVAVIGGGVAGVMAAISAAQKGAEVTVFEKNEKTGKKMYISGKGRCNVTNDCSSRDFLNNVVTNAKFLQGAIHKFSPSDAMEFCQSNGLPVKVERGNRVFPQSDKSSDVIKLFANVAKNCGVCTKLNCEVLQVEKAPDGFCLKTQQGNFLCNKVIVATGGLSYRATGCDGFGYNVAKSFGHNVTPLFPALCKILCKNTQSLEGISLKNVEVGYCDGGKTTSEFGEMLFTSDGVSGPAVLSLSSRINKIAQKEKGEIFVDLKPALDEEKLNARILRDFSERMNKNFGNALDALLPERLVVEVVKQSGIPFNKKINQITAAERAKLVATLKRLAFPFVGLDKLDFAIVTSGGVDVKQVNPSTMESKLQNGLYFAGEVLDVDAFTGGFNIQIALSTGFVAGASAATAE